MQTILKLKKYTACAALVATAAGLTGCYVGPAYGPRAYARPYAYAAPAPAYGYYGYYGRPNGYGYYRGDRW